ncbi:fibronectin type III domain-containing protein [Williamwhitmania taraxaci]|uniref:Fibronectin type 3 domain-containing protein n=1 Tax=Williamwhitmania taraxaci TaxID=1640674 RepID=A0A1G6RSH0_9BACT|nr:hypothetical protein [Williamwhitmania taraxaci]SDD07650.1 hypothetical protein SAMN05216323_10804 [Williamwhitmania taraxaci]
MNTPRVVRSARRAVLVMVRITLLVALFFVAGHGVAQENKIWALAKSKGDSVLIRWAPESIPVWQVGIKHGYVIERTELSSSSTDSSGIVMLSKLPVMAYSPAELEMLDKEEPFASVIYETFYSQEFKPALPEQGVGNFLQSYNEMEMRFGFSLFVCDFSTRVARAAGLFFVDKDVKPGKRYAYRISLADSPAGLTVAPGIAVVDAGKETVLAPPTDVVAVFSDRSVKLRWPSFIHKGLYTAYKLERSFDGKQFTPTTELPLVNATREEDPMFFFGNDSVPENNRKVYYRVKGLTPFGEESPASDVVSGMCFGSGEVAATIDTVMDDKRGALVRWTMGGDVKSKKVWLLRSPSSGKPYEPLTKKPLKSDATEFVDAAPLPNNFYKLRLEAADGSATESFPYMYVKTDSMPPVAPTGLMGKIDSAGVVTLSWNANTDADIDSYKVFRGNSLNSTFMDVSNYYQKANIFTDTVNLQTLNKAICYKVVAYDRRYNASDFSKVLLLNLPDTIPPVPCQIVDIEEQRGEVALAFEPSPSSDVATYRLLRRQETDSVGVEVAKWAEKSLPARYNDAPAATDKRYGYTLETVDISGNRNYSLTRYAYVQQEAKLRLRLDGSATGNAIALTWERIGGTNPIYLYRAADEAPFSLLVLLPSSDTGYSDTSLEHGHRYRYLLKVEQQLSIPIIVEF